MAEMCSHGLQVSTRKTIHACRIRTCVLGIEKQPMCQVYCERKPSGGEKIERKGKGHRKYNRSLFHDVLMKIIFMTSPL